MHLLGRTVITVIDVDPGDMKCDFADGDRFDHGSAEFGQVIGERTVEIEQTVRQSRQQDGIGADRFGDAGDVEYRSHGHRDIIGLIGKSPGGGKEIVFGISRQYDRAVDQPLTNLFFRTSCSGMNHHNKLLHSMV